MNYFEYIKDIIANARGDPPLKGIKVVEFARATYWGLISHASSPS